MTPAACIGRTFRRLAARVTDGSDTANSPVIKASKPVTAKLRPITDGLLVPPTTP
jgi:hypothetical protein